MSHNLRENRVFTKVFFGCIMRVSILLRKNMQYTSKDGEILISIPASNKGKFRFKKRENRLEFGEIFSTREEVFDEKSYLEWQIGYDVWVNDVMKGEKTTALRDKTFIGANRKEKYLYELSEIVHEAVNAGLLTGEELGSLLQEVQNYNEYIDEKKIEIESKSKISIHNIDFEELAIKLPTLFLFQESDKTQIEVSIQKQQHASGLQPMVYLSIPLLSFENYKDLLDKSSSPGDELIYAINEQNIEVLWNLIRVFGLCSKRHNHDIQEILKVLVNMSAY